MLGRALAPLDTGPRRWLHRAWGYPDIHTRQHWRALWPVMAAQPRSSLALIDAGCGTGRWALELAARRPRWRVLGVDRDPAAIAQAEAARQRLDLRNATFLVADFQEFDPPWRCDLLLSVASAHYLATEGRGAALFSRYASWMMPGARLVLLGPRTADMPFVSWLAHPAWHRVFTAAEIQELCDGARLELERLSGCIGPCGVFAKQLAWTAGRHGPLAAAASYPLQWMVAQLDRVAAPAPSLMWLLVARRCLE